MPYRMFLMPIITSLLVLNTRCNIYLRSRKKSVGVDERVLLEINFLAIYR